VSEPHATHTTQRRALPLKRREQARGGFLVVIQGPQLGQCIPLHDVPIVIGRSSSADVQLDHASVSRAHCSVWQEHAHFYVRDLGSTNGTLLNERPTQQAELAEGDRLMLGEIVLKFVSRDSLEARYHEALYELATFDSLTQLYNRRKFRELLEAEVARGESERAPLALVFIDLDHFKRINDRLGHAAGDEVLRRVAAALRQALCGRQLAGRLGGEEFAAVLPDCPLPVALEWAENLRRGIFALRCEAGGSVECVTASFGVADWRAGMKTTAELMRAADIELFRAKAAGRNCVKSPV
jgi:diguanylate cyclase (GGDEF)-like protein